MTICVRIRNRARDALLASDSRGFVRFLPPGGALLVTDANRRGETEKLKAALCAAGFDCEERGGLLEISPADELIRELAHAAQMRAESAQIAWESPAHAAQALGRRWLRAQRTEFTPAGRQLVLETLRLLWQGTDHAIAGIEDLRARAAAMQRTGDRSGMHEAGIFLLSMES